MKLKKVILQSPDHIQKNISYSNIAMFLKKLMTILPGQAHPNYCYGQQQVLYQNAGMFIISIRST